MSLRKTLFIIRELAGGGAEKVFVEVLNGLKARGCPVEALLLFPSGERFADLDPAIPVHVVYLDCSWRALTALRLIRWLKVRWLLRRDVLNCLGSRAFETAVSFVEGVPLLIQSWIPAQRRVAWVRTDLLENHYTKVFFKGDEEKKYYGAVDAIVFDTQESKRQFEALFPGLNVARHVICNPLSQQQLRQYASAFEVPKRKITLCSVGRLSPEKGMEWLIDVAHRLKKEGFDFDVWIVGDGTERENLEAEIGRLGLTDVVFLKGFQKNPYPYMRQADVLVSPSKAEGFSLVVAEALCLGLPVVSTRTSGPQELLSDDYGILCDHSVEAVTAAIRSLLVSEGKRAYYAQRSRERAKMFDAERSLCQVERVVSGMECSDLAPL